MQWNVNAQDLLDGLNTVTRALSVRPAKQILEGVLLDADEENITLTASDGSLTIQSVIAADVQSIGRVVLPGKLLTELIRKLPGGQVNISVNDNFAAFIHCATSKSKLSGQNAAEYPEMPEVENGSMIEIPSAMLKEMISRVVFSIATDESRQILTGCLLEVTENEARLIALDGFRLAMQKVHSSFVLPEGQSQLRIVIPGRVLNEMSKILPDEDAPCRLTIGKGKMQVDFGNTTVSTVLLAGEYVDYQKILPPTFRVEAKASRTALIDAIDRASLMAREGKNNLIRMAFTKEKVTISSNAEMGDVQEEVEAVLTGDQLEIAFNAKYITDVIRNITDDEVMMKFNSNVSPCVITPLEGDNYLYLILPVRVYH